MDGMTESNVKENRPVTGKVIDLRGLTRFPSNSQRGARGMDAMVEFKIEVPWIEQPKLGEIFARALDASEYRGSRQALAEAVWDRYGKVSKSIESIASTFYDVMKGTKGGSDYVLFAESLLKVTLNTTGDPIPQRHVNKVARKRVESLERQRVDELNKEVNVPQKRRFAKIITEVIDTPLPREHFSPQGRRVFASVDGAGGTMLQLALSASVEADIPVRFENIPTAWGLQVSNNSMPMIKMGSVVWYDTTKETTEPDTLVLMVPVVISDVRRYVRRLMQVSETAFVVEPAVEFPFLRDQWRCLPILDVTGNWPSDVT